LFQPLKQLEIALKKAFKDMKLSVGGVCPKRVRRRFTNKVLLNKLYGRVGCTRLEVVLVYWSKTKVDYENKSKQQ